MQKRFEKEERKRWRLSLSSKRVKLSWEEREGFIPPYFKSKFKQETFFTTDENPRGFYHFKLFYSKINDKHDRHLIEKTNLLSLFKNG